MADAFGPGANVRSVGSDIQRGEVLLHAGDRVGPHELGIAALAGVSEARTRRAPLVAVLSTGDELADPFADGLFSSPDASASAGLIFDANRHMLLACAREVGARVMDLGIARDDPDALADAIARAVDAGADVVVASGGVSEGDKDHLKETLLGSFGRVAGEVHFGRVMMKPGKPLTFAEISRTEEDSTEDVSEDVSGTDATDAREGKRRKEKKTVLAFGLPGNPVSAAVTFALVVAPAVRRMLGGPTRGRGGSRRSSRRTSRWTRSARSTTRHAGLGGERRDFAVTEKQTQTCRSRGARDGKSAVA